MSDRLLVVDDDDSIREVFRSFFERAGFAVDTAGSLHEAAERLAASEYSAVIADVCLTESGSEGLAIAAYVRQTWTERPMVVLTAYGSPHKAEAAARLGADAFLHKPVSLVWLEGLVRARIAARRGEPTEEDARGEMAASG